jgi:ureidoglycolate lyase
MINLTPQPLTKRTFSAFGDVIETDGALHYPINQGTTERYHNLALVDVDELDGQPLISIFKSQPRLQPIALCLMERHPIASQAFIPLNQQNYLVVVAKPADTVNPADLIAFRARGDQGVNYYRGVWHHPLLVLEPDSCFLIVDRGGEGHNLDELWFDIEAEKVFLSAT